MESFLHLAQRRRSIRQYEDRAVEKEKIDTILQAALLSPASKRSNPWEFVVVTDREILRQMAGCRTYGSQMLEQTQVGIVVAIDSAKTDTWQCDGAIAAEHMLLAAEDLGLGGCWVQVYQREGAEELVKQLAHIPDSLNVLCIVSIGYKNEERKMRELDKLQYEKIHYGNF